MIRTSLTNEQWLNICLIDLHASAMEGLIANDDAREIRRRMVPKYIEARKTALVTPDHRGLVLDVTA